MNKLNEDLGFADTLNELNKGPAEGKDLPPLHPRPDELVDISKEQRQQDTIAQFMKHHKVRSNYRIFDISDSEQRDMLEVVMDHILRDGWILSYEEKVITPSGSALVFLKYLIPDDVSKKSKTEEEE